MDAREMVAMVVEGRLDVGVLAERVSAEELAALVRDERVLRLCEAGDLQGRVMASRFRGVVVAKLLELVNRTDVPAETVRRACVDLLKLAGEGRGKEEDAGLVEGLRGVLGEGTNG